MRPSSSRRPGFSFQPLPQEHSGVKRLQTSSGHIPVSKRRWLSHPVTWHQGRCKPVQGRSRQPAQELILFLRHPGVILPGVPLRCLSPSPSIHQLSLISIQAPGTDSSLRLFFFPPSRKEHGFSFKPFVEGGNMSNRDEPFGNQIKAKNDEKRTPRALWE